MQNLEPKNYERFIDRGTFKNVYQLSGNRASAIFRDRYEGSAEMGLYKIVSLMDPYHYYTIQPLYSVNRSLNPMKEDVLAKLGTFGHYYDAGNSLYEIVFPLGGQKFSNVIRNNGLELDKQEPGNRLGKFLIPILFLAHWIGYMNEKNYQHKDIKDGNILYRNGMLKLIDFGFLGNDLDLVVGLEEERYFVWPPEVRVLGRMLKSRPNYSSSILSSENVIQYLSQNVRGLNKRMKKHKERLLKNYNENESLLNQQYGTMSPTFLSSLEGSAQDYDRRVKECERQSTRQKNIAACKFKERPILQQPLMKHFNKFDSYGLGITILSWIQKFDEVETTSTLLPADDKEILKNFEYFVYKSLAVYNPEKRLTLSDFHALFLEELAALTGGQRLIKQYKEFCENILSQNLRAAKPGFPGVYKLNENSAFRKLIRDLEKYGG
jgi:serine/threonine protein kinase